MSIKQAIEALESCAPGDYSTGHVIHPSYDEEKVNAALAALRSMPAEPVAWREAVQRLVTGFEHVSGIARAWEPDHSSGSDRAKWARATEACADVAKLLATPQTEAVRQALTDPENQPNQFGVTFGMRGPKMYFAIGHQSFTLDYAPEEPGEFEFMRDMLTKAMSVFTPDVKPEAVRMSEAWISVDERLPGEQGCDSEEVMLFINGHCEITDMECRQGGAWGLRLGYFDAEKQAFRVHGRPESFVTHWQALPPPPVEQATAARLGVKLGDTRHADQA